MKPQSVVNRAIDEIKRLRYKYRKNSTIIKKAKIIAAAYNEQIEPFEIEVNADINSELDLRSGWIPVEIYQGGIHVDTIKL